MNDNFQLTQSYLNGYKDRQHRLADLINNPDASKGLIYTPGEIAQQPHLWRYTAAQLKLNSQEIISFLERAGLFNKTGRPHIIFTGAGSSDFVGNSLVDLFRVTFQTEASHWATPRITANPDDFFNVEQNYIVIHLARSGNSPESRAVLNMILKKYPDNVHHIVITCNKEGQISNISRQHPNNVYLINLHEDSNDKGLAMTSSFSSMVIAGQCIAHIRNIDSFEQTVNDIASAAEHFIDSYADYLYEFADTAVERLFFLGNKDLLGAAAESALKVQELTAGELLTKHDDPMSFRHGPVSAVDHSSIVCFFLSEDPLTCKYETDVIKQYENTFHDIGTKTIVVGANHEHLFKDSHVQYFSYNPEDKWQIGKFNQVNIAVIFGQLFGMFQAIHRGINVDNPSAEKPTYSRVVEGVKLYEA